MSQSEGKSASEAESANESTSEHAVLEALRNAAEGLLFQSETDAPLLPFFWPDDHADALTPECVLQLTQVPEGAPVKVVTLAAFFRAATKEQAWHNEQEKAEVEKCKALVATLKTTLKRPQVFRVGETSINVYIVGAVEGGYAGLLTHVVET